MKDLRECLLRRILTQYEAETAFQLELGDNYIEAYNEFISVISKDTYNLKEISLVSRRHLENILAMIFPDRVLRLHARITKYIFTLANIKECKKCMNLLDISEFRANSSKSDGLNTQCRYCQSKSTAVTQAARQAKYKSSKLLRTPSWANTEAISEFYKKCPPGYHVDHIIPLQGNYVSGLHVENNLQYLTAKENISKHNSFTID